MTGPGKPGEAITGRSPSEGWGVAEHEHRPCARPRAAAT
jgi:hypothetical protein